MKKNRLHTNENTVAYLGPQGTFSHQAALQISYYAKPYASLHEIIQAVEIGKVEWGILPLENSLEGAVTETMDLLLELNGSKMVKEIVLPIQYHLLIPANKNIESIKKVLSHPQALGQCRELFHDHPYLEQISTKSTAEAAKRAAEDNDNAALGPYICQKIYHLTSVWCGPKKQTNNETRFVVLGHEKTKPTGNDCTSITFGTEDVPGGLYGALKVFYEENINLSRIESRPSKKRLGEYIFFVDCEGHQDEQSLSRALERLKNATTFFKFFGSYRRVRNYKSEVNRIDCSHG